MKPTVFDFIDKGFENTLVLIPGWATDWKIFEGLDLKYNYLLPVEFSPFDFAERLHQTMEERNIKKISLLGWSMGGFVAVDFAAKFGDIAHELILVGIRKKYSPREIEKIKAYLTQNKDAYLYKFYASCFAEKREFAWFKNKLLKEYLTKFVLDYLLQTLDYLAGCEINVERLRRIKRLKILHGEKDEIVPVWAAMQLKSSLPQAEFIRLKNAGHVVFQQKNFNQIFCNKED
ncbi:MAG: alpha/beta hydrolase [Candidatus Omnitrophota bacterium]